MSAPYFDPYSRIERAMVSRLATGLGRMVREVASYGGELDDEPARIIQALPAVWVTFAGIVATKPHSTARGKWLTTGRFAVMAGQQNARSEAASRHGAGRAQEIGTNALVWAVRRLLTYQDLTDQDQSLQISPLRPGRVRTLFNTSVAERAMSVFAAEFDVDWIEHALPNGAWPVPLATEPELGVPGAPDSGSPYDELFGLHPTTSTQPPASRLAGVDLTYHLYPANRPEPTATDQVDFPPSNDHDH